MGTAWLAGATGLVGGCLVRELLAQPAYGEIVAVGRRPPAVTHPRLRPVVTDFADLERAAAAETCDDAFCCLGTTRARAGSREAFRAVDHGAVLAFAWRARRCGARRFFLVSSVGADPASRFFYLRVKGETEEALKVLGFATLALFRPGLLLGTRAAPRMGERAAGLVLRLAAPLLAGPLRPHRPVAAETVARAMARCAAGTAAAGVGVFSNAEIEALAGAAGAP